MKRLFAIVPVAISLLFLSACSEISFTPSGEKKTTIDQQTFLIETSWELAAEHQEAITLKEIEYTNAYYHAKMSGELFYNADDNPNSYEIAEQEVEFRQEYGTIWSTTISVEQLGEMTIYAHRLGDGYISDKEYSFDDFTMTAIEYRSYSYINFFFYSNQTYLLFE